MYNLHDVPIIIPSYEPDERLLPLLADLTSLGFHNILLVDDGSGEAYGHYFASAEADYGCQVLRHACNLGKGRALKNAFNHLLLTQRDIIGCITADSDGQHSPACISACIEALLAHPDSLILGVRNFNDASVPLKSSLGNKVTRFMFRTLCGVTVSDTQTGLRGIPASFMRELLSSEGERFEFESNMLIDARKDVPILEVPIQTIYDSKTNHTSHFNPLLDSFRIYKVFGKFLFSSLSSTAIDLSLFQLFIILFKSGFTQYITLATLGARLISATVNFTLNRAIVFESNTSALQSGLRYALLCILQAAASSFFVTQLHLLFASSELVIKFFVDITLFFISFQIQRAYIFTSDKRNAKKIPSDG